MAPLSDVLSDDNSLHRISIQVTKSQYKTLKAYARPGTSISSMIRRAIDDMFEPVIQSDNTKDLLPESQTKLEEIRKQYEQLKEKLQPETSITNAAS
jgi:hypothetical protein